MTFCILFTYYYLMYVKWLAMIVFSNVSFLWVQILRYCVIWSNWNHIVICLKILIWKFFWLVCETVNILFQFKVAFFRVSYRGHSNNTWHPRGVEIVSPNDTWGGECFQKCLVTFSQNLGAKFSCFDHFLGHFWVWNNLFGSYFHTLSHIKLVLARLSFQIEH